MRIILICLFMSIIGVANEALIYAKHGCEVEKSEKSCEVYERLKRLNDTKGLPKKEFTTFKANHQDKKGKETNINVNIDNDLLEMIETTCNDYSKSILSCSPYTCEIKDPFGGITKVEIVGEEGNLCIVREDKPTNGLTVCKFKEVDLDISGEIIDSKLMKHSDRHEAWLNDGTCVFTAY